MTYPMYAVVNYFCNDNVAHWKDVEEGPEEWNSEIKRYEHPTVYRDDITCHGGRAFCVPLLLIGVDVVIVLVALKCCVWASSYQLHWTDFYFLAGPACGIVCTYAIVGIANRVFKLNLWHWNVDPKPSTPLSSAAKKV